MDYYYDRRAMEILERIYTHSVENEKKEYKPFSDEMPKFEINYDEFFQLKRHVLSTREEAREEWMPLGTLPPFYGVKTVLILNYEF